MMDARHLNLDFAGLLPYRPVPPRVANRETAKGNAIKGGDVAKRVISALEEDGK